MQDADDRQPDGAASRTAEDARHPRRRICHDLPGAAGIAQPGAHYRHADHGSYPPAPAGEQGRKRASMPSRCCAASRSHARADHRLLSAPAQRRHVPACHDRTGPGLPAGPAHRRRADDGTGRHHGSADSGPDAATCNRNSTSIMYITHNMAVVAEIADESRSCTWGRWWRPAMSTRSSTNRSTRTRRRCCARSHRSEGKMRERLDPIKGMVPDPFNRPQGCPFHPAAVSVCRASATKSCPTVSWEAATWCAACSTAAREGRSDDRLDRAGLLRSA